MLTIMNVAPGPAAHPAAVLKGSGITVIMTGKFGSGSCVVANGQFELELDVDVDVHDDGAVGAESGIGSGATGVEIAVVGGSVRIPSSWSSAVVDGGSSVTISVVGLVVVVLVPVSILETVSVLVTAVMLPSRVVPSEN